LPGPGAPAAAPQVSAEQSPVAIICGGGAFPEAVANAVVARGRPVLLFLLRGFADPSLARYPHEWVRLGSFGKFMSANRKHGVKDVVIIGSVVRPRISQLGLDWRAVLLLPRVARMFLGGDNSLLTGVAKVFAENGLTIRGPHEVAPEILLPTGLATNLKPTEQEQADIDVGCDLLHAIDRFDVGQAVVIAGKRVVAVEGAEGTEGLLARVAEMRGSGRLRLRERDGVMVKLPKPSQDRRLDMPAVGIDTIRQAKAAGLAGIAVESGGALVLDAQQFVETAEREGLFVVALSPQAPR